MVGKITKGTSFNNALNYIIDQKKDAEIIASDGVSLDSIGSIIDSFETQSSMRPGVSKPVYHISLSFHPKDKEKLNNELVTKIMNDYLAMMKLNNTQFIAVRHFDKDHPHIHLCINRIDYDGKLISDQNNYRQNEIVATALTKKYGLYFSDGKNMNYDRLREPESTKYFIRDVMNNTVPNCRSWNDLRDELSKEQIQLEFKYKGSTDKIDGVIFTYKNISLSGSKIDRQYSYSKINALFEQSKEQQEGKEKLSLISLSSRSVDISENNQKEDQIDNIIDIIVGDENEMSQSQGGGGENNELPKRRRR